MSDLLKQKITVGMTVREALCTYAVMYNTNGEKSIPYSQLYKVLGKLGDVEAVKKLSVLDTINYLGLQDAVERAFLFGNKSEAETKIDKLEEKVKQLQSQIQALRTTVGEG